MSDDNFKCVKPSKVWTIEDVDYADLEVRATALQMKAYQDMMKAYVYGGDPIDMYATSTYLPEPQTYDCAGCNKQTNYDECLTISYPSTGDAAEQDCFCPSCSKALLTDISYRKKAKR